MRSIKFQVLPISLIPPPNKIEFLSSGVLILKVKWLKIKLTHSFINSKMHNCFCIHFHNSVVGINLSPDRILWFNTQVSFFFLSACKLMRCLTIDGILDQMKYSIFYLHLWAITHKSTSVKWGGTIWLKKEICV